MTLKHLGNNVWYTDTAGERPTGVPAQATVMELPTRVKWTYDGTLWKLGDLGISDYTWLVYKSGPNYKAKNGHLGYVPTAAISTDLDTVWAYIKANFNIANDEIAGTGGLIQLHKGTFDFSNQVVLDNTYGNSNTGMIVQGMGMNTLVRFVPGAGAPIDAGFVVNGPLRQTQIKNLDIELDNFTTNAIRINSAAGDNLNGLYEDLRIVNSANVTAQSVVTTGQRGIYMVNGASPNTLHFNTFRNIWIRYLDTGIETNMPVTNRNASFLNFYDMKMWRCLKGLKIGDHGLEHHIHGMFFQDTAVGVADYAVSIGVGGAHNQIINLVADAISKVGAAAIIVNANAIHNSGYNIQNTGVHTVLDYSGNITNNFKRGFSNNQLSGNLKLGWWDPVSADTTNGNTVYGSGLFAHAGSLKAIVNGTGTADTEFFDATNGDKGVKFASGVTTDDMIGFRGDKYFTRRANWPVFFVRFVLGSTSSLQRIFFLLTENKANPPNSNQYVTTGSASCIGLRVTSGSANFQIIRNDNAGTPVVSDCLWPDDTVIPLSLTRSRYAAADNSKTATSEAHTFWVYGDTNSGWWTCLDDGKVTNFTTDVPIAATNLTVLASVQNTTTGAGTEKSFVLNQMRLESLR